MIVGETMVGDRVTQMDSLDFQVSKIIEVLSGVFLVGGISYVIVDPITLTMEQASLL